MISFAKRLSFDETDDFASLMFATHTVAPAARQRPTYPVQARITQELSSLRRDIDSIKEDLYGLGEQVLATYAFKPPTSILSDDFSGRFIARFLHQLFDSPHTLPLFGIRVPLMMRFGAQHLLKQFTQELTQLPLGPRPLLVTESIITGQTMGRMVEVLRHRGASPHVASLGILQFDITEIRSRICGSPGDMRPNPHLEMRPRVIPTGETKLLFGVPLHCRYSDPKLTPILGNKSLHGLEMRASSASGATICSALAEITPASWIETAQTDDERAFRSAVSYGVDQILVELVEEFFSYRAHSISQHRPPENSTLDSPALGEASLPARS